MARSGGVGTQALLEEREGTHGSFRSNAVAYNRLLEAIPLESYHPLVRYAVAGIYFKLARMVSGHCLFRGHWEDVAGYGEKVVEMIDAGGDV